jgi:hypothetical protein
MGGGAHGSGSQRRGDEVQEQVGLPGFQKAVDPNRVSSSRSGQMIDPAMQAAVDVDRLLSEAAGLQRIVDLAGEVTEGARPTPLNSGGPTGSTSAAMRDEPDVPG